MNAAQWIGVLLLSMGWLAALVGVVGILRMPTFYMRMKPFSLVTTVAACGIHLGTSFLFAGSWGAKGALTAVVFLVTSPALAQALMVLAHHLDVPHGSAPDELGPPGPRRDTRSP